MIKTIQVFLICFLSLGLSINAQSGFKGSAILGVNFAQIDGDNLAGYDKPGISAGMKIAYPLKPVMDISLEMLYSVRGSQESLFGDNGGGLGTTSLHYIELPILISYKDWVVEADSYHKVFAEGGLSLGNLFNVESRNTTYNDGIGNLRKFDISYVLGLGYNFNSHMGFSFRYTRSLVDLYKLEGRLLSYFITLRTHYTF